MTYRSTEMLIYCSTGTFTSRCPSTRTYAVLYVLNNRQIQTGENFTSVVALCCAEHFFSQLFLSVLPFFAYKKIFFLFFLMKPQKILHTMCDPCQFLKNIYVKASPRKNTSEDQYAAKHNATANRVNIIWCRRGQRKCEKSILPSRCPVQQLI